jgi:hypothetical protein
MGGRCSDVSALADDLQVAAACWYVEAELRGTTAADAAFNNFGDIGVSVPPQDIVCVEVFDEFAP